VDIRVNRTSKERGSLFRSSNRNDGLKFQKKGSKVSTPLEVLCETMGVKSASLIGGVSSLGVYKNDASGNGRDGPDFSRGGVFFREKEHSQGENLLKQLILDAGTQLWGVPSLTNAQ